MGVAAQFLIFYFEEMAASKKLIEMNNNAV